MLPKSLFNKEEISKRSLNRVSLIDEQATIVDRLLQIAIRHIQIDEIAMRGYILMAIQNWQKRRLIAIGELRNMAPGARVTFVREIGSELELVLSEPLKEPKDRPLVHQAVHEIVKIYETEFSARGRPN